MIAGHKGQVIQLKSVTCDLVVIKRYLAIVELELVGFQLSLKRKAAHKVKTMANMMTGLNLCFISF